MSNDIIKQKLDGDDVELFVDEDGEWGVYYAELPNVSAFGFTQEEALAELKIAREAYYESIRGG